MITPGMCVTAKAEFLAGVHKSTDRYMIALYGAEADVSPKTEAYTPTGEVSGIGYESGGRDVSGWRIGINGTGAFVTFDDVMWSRATITARGALVYNASAQGLPAVAVLDFGQTVVATNGPFLVRAPDAVITID